VAAVAKGPKVLLADPYRIDPIADNGHPDGSHRKCGGSIKPRINSVIVHESSSGYLNKCVCSVSRSSADKGVGAIQGQ
jgi:hypothetical protein